MNQKPFIHTFKAGKSYFIYDVNTDKILKVNAAVYNYLNKIEHNLEKESDWNIEIEDEINTLINYGFLKNKRVSKTMHPETKYIKYHIENNLSSIILQVTQNCNLRCDYCIYSGLYSNRVHTNKRMNIDVAKRSIDYLIKNSSQLNEVSVGFYGGEPLLEFDLIKQIVEYVKVVGEGKEIYFNLTTNATLFNEEIIEFFVKNNITTMISLDGGKEIHDKSRKFANTGEGSHDVVLKNVRYIKNKYPEYYKKNITFNTVINSENDYISIDDFISKNETLKDSNFLASTLNNNYSDKEIVSSDEYILGKSYDRFLTLLNKLKFIKDESMSPLSRIERALLDDFRYEKNIEGRLELPDVWHHGGPCIPGAFRIFVTTDGEFFPCERVSESSKMGMIGNLDSGVDIEKAEKLLNIGKLYEEQCSDCWAYSYCDICIAKIDDTKCNENEIKPHDCDRIRHSTENNMKDYCVLKSLGYQY